MKFIRWVLSTSVLFVSFYSYGAGVEDCSESKTFYRTQRGDSLYFCLEKMDIKKLAAWKKFAERNLKEYEGRRDSRIEEEGQATIVQLHSVDGASHFKAALESADEDTLALVRDARKALCAEVPVPEAWVAYAVDFHCLEDWPETLPEDEWMGHVEMSFCVMTQPDLPAVQHMGISRNPFYEGIRHSKISTALHSVSAMHFLEAHPEKELLITRPIGTMTNLLVESLGESVHTDYLKRVSFNKDNSHLVILNPDLSETIYSDFYPFWLIGHTVVAPLQGLADKV